MPPEFRKTDLDLNLPDMDLKEPFLPSLGDEEARPSLRTSRRATVLRYRIAISSLLATLLFWNLAFNGWTGKHLRWWDQKDVTQCGGMIMDFMDIEPSTKLVWHPCFSVFKCARLTVPMDYNRPLTESPSNPKVHIALLLFPGTGPPSVSPLLINPGGPGGSGVEFAKIGAERLQVVLGPDQDIIGFDPRGIGSTVPLIDCFAFPLDMSTDPNRELTEMEKALGSYRRLEWMLTGANIQLLDVNSTEEDFANFDRRVWSAGLGCGEKDKLHGEDSIFKHVSTPAVAHDMLSIVDAWDAWRAEELGDEIIEQERLAVKEQDEINLDTKGKLVYWGFSYGTLLGATFASMFPERVGRLVLDGVVDADVYVSPMWSESLVSLDAIEASFFTYCFMAGDLCALYRPGDATATISDRFYGILEDLKTNPFVGVHKKTKMPLVTNHLFLKAALFSSFYSPVVAFPMIAEIMDGIFRYKSAFLEQISLIPAVWAEPSPFCTQKHISRPLDGLEAIMAIMCGDKRYPLDESPAELQARFQKMAGTSSYADIWMGLMMRCSHWPIKTTDPPLNWSLPHSAVAPGHVLPTDNSNPPYSTTAKKIKTAFPILFISNTLDPVTPLVAGLTMARKFSDAGFLEVQTEGHCSISAVSLCSMKKIRAYVRGGKVPAVPKGTVGNGQWETCCADEHPWKRFNGEAWMAKKKEDVQHSFESNELVEQARIMQAWGDLRADWAGGLASRRNSPWGFGVSGAADGLWEV